MAVSTNKVTSALIIKLKVGTLSNGKDKLSNVTLNRVKTTAADQDVYDVADKISALLKYPVNSTLRQDRSELINA